MARQRERLVAIDLTRGVASLLVMVSHARSFIVADFSPGMKVGPVERAFYFLTGFGHEAVMVFFVLSGFLVGGSVLQQNLDGRWSWRSYLIRRLVRLEIVVVPALVLTLFWDLLGGHTVGAGGYAGAFSDFVSSGPSVDHPADHSPATFVGNVVFLQTIFVPVFGTNGPLWSLANEFWYYVLFPLMLVTMTASRGYLTRILHLLGFIAVVLLLPFNITVLFSVWLLGVLAYVLLNSGAPHVAAIRDHGVTPWLIGFAFLAALYVSRVRLWDGADYLIGLTFALLVPAIARMNIGNRAVRAISSFTSDISYSLYVSHFPLLAAIYFSLMAPARLEATFPTMLLTLSLCLLCVLQGWLLWFFAESRTSAVYRALGQRSLLPAA